jgi:hypothetical protein
MTDRSTTTPNPDGIRAFVARRPVTAFLIMAFCDRLSRHVAGGPCGPSGHPRWLTSRPATSPTGRNRRPDVDDVCPVSFRSVRDLGRRWTTRSCPFVQTDCSLAVCRRLVARRPCGTACADCGLHADLGQFSGINRPQQALLGPAPAAVDQLHFGQSLGGNRLGRPGWSADTTSSWRPS